MESLIQENSAMMATVISTMIVQLASGTFAETVLGTIEQKNAMVMILVP